MHPGTGAKGPLKFYAQYIEEMIADERQKEKSQMSTLFYNIKIRMTHAVSGVNCEFDLGPETSPKEAKDAIIQLMEAGFIRTTTANITNKVDHSGKAGRVTSSEKVEGKNQWKFVVTLEEVGAGQQTIIKFDKDALRIGDRVRLSKNDKGYYDTTIINNEGPEGEKQADIPF